jgi:hypothetical protein
MSLTKAPPWNNVHVHPPALEHVYEGCSFCGRVGGAFELSGITGGARFVGGC